MDISSMKKLIMICLIFSLSGCMTAEVKYDMPDKQHGRITVVGRVKAKGDFGTIDTTKTNWWDMLKMSPQFVKDFVNGIFTGKGVQSD